MSNKGAIFDLDGTLLDSMHIWHKIDCIFLQECGVEIPNNLVDVLKTMTIEGCVQYFIDELGVTLTKEEVFKRFDELMREVYLTKIEPKPFARELLEKYSSDNIKMCVATANEYDLTCETLHKLGLLQYFEFVTTCGKLECSKTEPYIYNYCAQRLGFKPDEVVVYEDAPHCVESAKNAGFYVVGVHDKSSECEEAHIKKIADRYIYTFEGEILL